MNFLSFFCLLFAVVYAEDEESNDGLGVSEKVGSSGKRWAQGDQAYQPGYSKDFPELNFETETKGQERAKHEKTFKDFLGYEAIQSVLINALKPKPIVDTAEESEKLAPNDGSSVQFLGDLVVRGTETLSRALNTVIDRHQLWVRLLKSLISYTVTNRKSRVLVSLSDCQGPKKAITKLSAGATQALNQLGAYLVGL